MTTTDSDVLNYRGVLYALGANQAPFLASIGGKTKRANAFTYPIAQPYSVGNGAQNVYSEDNAAGTLTPTTVTRSQDTNVAQIMLYAVKTTFKKQSVYGQMSGVNTNDANPVLDELGFQKQAALMKMAKDMEFTLLQGEYVAESNSATEQSTRGLKHAISTNTVAGGSAALEKAMIEELIRKMLASGSLMMDPVILCNSFQMQRLSDIYGYAPQDRTTGGVAIDRIMVPGAGILPTLFSPQMPTDEIYIVDRSVCSPVFVPVSYVDDGNVNPSIDNVNGVDILYQPTAITNAARGGFFYTQFGFDYGPEEYHGSITGLATTA